MAEYVNQASGVRVSVRDEKELGEGWVFAEDYEEPHGDTGDSGDSGDDGDTGDSGADGDSGDSGDDGNDVPEEQPKARRGRKPAAE